MPLLDIRDLQVDFPSQGGVLHAVDGVSLKLEEGEVLGIVGESGSGKSVTMMALMGLVGWPGQVRAQHMRFAGHDLLGIAERERRRLVGKEVAMIFQEPTTSLNPCFTVGWQLMESLRQHLNLDKRAARRRATELLEQVGIPAASSRLSSYPHQLSGGMNQRVMIAMAIACNPRLLIADEPTTALDVTIQAQILDLLRELQKERGMGLVLITHNMGVVSEMAQRVAVMYAGQVMEERAVDELFAAPQHPYTAALLAALPERTGDGSRLATIPGMVPGLHDRPAGCLFAPRCAYATEHSRAERPALREWMGGQVRCHYALGDPERNRLRERDGAVPAEERGMSPAQDSATTQATAPAVDAVMVRPADGAAGNAEAVVEARDLQRIYSLRRGIFRAPAQLQAVGSISFRIEPGRTLAVVGESGSGKSTLARMVSLIEKPSAGSLRLAGADAVDPPAERRRELRRTVQLVFQNPYGSLNPRKKIGAVLEDPLAINTTLGRAERAARAREMLARVGLRPEHANRYPHMFSGGQRQRIAIARALMLQPRLLVADEPVSALDVSIQAQVLNLLADLQSELGLAYLFISHDLGVVRHIAHDVLVMYLGHAVEQGPKTRIFARPLHPYTQALLCSTPGLADRRIVLKGELPSPLAPPPGCVFNTRCAHATERCRSERPILRTLDERLVACHHAEQFLTDSQPSALARAQHQGAVP